MNLVYKSNSGPQKGKIILILPELNSWYIQIIYFFILSVYGIRKIIGDGKHETLVLTSNQWITGKLQEVSISCKLFYEYGKGIPLGKINTWASSVLNIWSKIMDRDSVNNAMSFRGISFLELIAFEGVRGLDWIFRESAKTVVTVENVIDVETPHEIFLLDVRQLHEKAVFEIAKSRGIKVSVILPSMVSSLIFFFVSSAKLSKIYWNNSKRMFFSIRKSLSKFRRKTNGKDVDTRSIILLQNYYVTAPQFISVIKELRKDSKNEITVLCIKKADQKILIRANEDFKEFNYFIDQKSSREIYQAQTSINEAWLHLIHIPRLQKLMKYRNIKLFDLIENELVTLYPHTCFEGIEALTYLRRIGKLDLIVVGNDHGPYEKLFVRFGKLNQVPTLNIRYAKEHSGSAEIISDKIAVWGQASKDALIESGAKAEKIVVTGNPRFDLLLKLKTEFRKDIFFNQQKITLDKKIIAIAVGPFTYKAEGMVAGERSEDGIWTKMLEERRTLLRILGKILEKNPELQIIIKPHPRDDAEFVEAVVSKIITDGVIIDKEIDTYELICACDVLITKDSTVGFEAMVLGKPVICFDFIGQLDRNKYVSNGAAIGVSDVGELELAIKNTMENQDVMKDLRNLQKKYVRNFGFKQDGHASRRVANLIYNMIEESNNPKHD